MSFLVSVAHDTGMRISAKPDANWAMLRAELVAKFGIQKSAFLLMRELRAIKQDRRCVSDFVIEFDNKLDYLISARSSDTLTIATVFLEGIDQGLRVKLLELLMLQSDDPMKKIGDMEVRDAIRFLSNLARRREELDT